MQPFVSPFIGCWWLPIGTFWPHHFEVWKET